ENPIFQLLVLLGVVQTQQSLDRFVTAATRDGADRSFAKFQRVRPARDLEQPRPRTFALAISKTRNDGRANVETLIRIVDSEQSIDRRLTRPAGNAGYRQPALRHRLALDRNVTEHHDRALTRVFSQRIH